MCLRASLAAVVARITDGKTLECPSALDAVDGLEGRFGSLLEGTGTDGTEDDTC